MSKEIVLGTAHIFNWFNLGAAINHPEAGRILDLSESINQELHIPDADVKIMPYNGYGDAGVVRWVMETQKPDAIMIFTDPRYWVWLFQMEHELRQVVPIIYYSLWDDLPVPLYNKPYYQSCDALFGISKQSHGIHRECIGEENCELITFEKLVNA